MSTLSNSEHLRESESTLEAEDAKDAKALTPDDTGGEHLRSEPLRELNGQAGHLLDQLRRLHEHHSANLQSRGYDPLGAKVEIREWQRHAKQAGISAQDFRQAVRGLEESQRIRVENSFVYVVDQP